MLDKKYPHEVRLIYELVKGKEIKQTHISYVILTDDYVYKIKKPLDFGFLDFTKAKDRRKFCVLEKELNERFSKGVYEDVMKLCKKNELEYCIEPLQSSLYALEYIVKMKRIKDDDFLFKRIEQNLVSDEMMTKVGVEVAKLLSALDKADLESIEDYKSNYDTIRFNAVENFQQTETYVNTFINKDIFDYIKSATLKFLDENKAIFNIRHIEGYVKDGHGDLRLEHIYFNADGSVGLIDCIEFNKRFRYNDIISEAAFLSMELDINGLSHYANLFMKGFLSIINDATSLKLLNYYRSYLAYVRAKVTLFMLGSQDKSWEFYDAKSAEVTRLLNFSALYLSSSLNMKTFLFYGLMGTGKTKNAKSFSEFLPVAYISSDEARKHLAGVEITEKMYLDYNKGIYSKKSSFDVYHQLSKFANDMIKIGRAVVIDASFTDPEYYKIITENIKTSFFKVQFTAPDDVIYARLKARLTKDVVSDGRPAIYEAQKTSAKFPQADITIITTNEISDNINQIFFAAIK